MQFIYELGVNWCGRLGGVEYATRLIDQIADADPEAWIKLQWFNHKTLCTLDASFHDGRNMRDVLHDNEPEWSELLEVAAYARTKGLGVGCTAFNADDALMVIGSDLFTFYKIGSPDFIDKSMVHRYMTVMQRHYTPKTLVMSTGGCTREEIRDMLSFLTVYTKTAQKQQTEIILMHCVSTYPQTDPAWGALMDLTWLVGLYKNKLMDEGIFLRLGLSSHISLDNYGDYSRFYGCPFGTVEVHVSEDVGDVDANVSLHPEHVQSLKKEWEAKARYPSRPDDSAILHTRRYWVAIDEIKKGDMFTGKNVRAMRSNPRDPKGRTCVGDVLLRGECATKSYHPGEHINDWIDKP